MSKKRKRKAEPRRGMSCAGIILVLMCFSAAPAFGWPALLAGLLIGIADSR